MEKDDKIQHLRAQARKKAAMWLFVLIAAAAILSVAVDVIDKTAAESSMSGTGIDDDDSVDHDNSILQQNQNVRVGNGNGNGVGDAIIPDAKAAEASVNDRSIRLEALEREYRQLDQQVRAIKATGVIMETDPESLKVTSELQNVARRLLVAKYGKHESYRVRVDLEFPPTIPDYNTHPSGKYGTLVIEMAPIDLIPVSVYTFLEVARTFVSGAFHRNAGHVLQVKVRSKEIKQHLPFQEYSKEFPHKKGTTGYCGRPSGPCWYVSIRDNTRNHGPGSQQKHNPHEADANFGFVVEGGMEDVVPRIHSIPQTEWLDAKNQIKQLKYTILVPDETKKGTFREWSESRDGLPATTSTA